jgi:hypothetical protein
LKTLTKFREGLLDRSWIAGVTSLEVMLAHVVAQFAVMVVQVALVLVFMILVFQVRAMISKIGTKAYLSSLAFAVRRQKFRCFLWTRRKTFCVNEF